jgi:hypothetical protein
MSEVGLCCQFRMGQQIKDAETADLLLHHELPGPGQSFACLELHTTGSEFVGSANSAPCGGGLWGLPTQVSNMRLGKRDAFECTNASLRDPLKDSELVSTLTWAIAIVDSDSGMKAASDFLLSFPECIFSPLCGILRSRIERSRFGNGAEKPRAGLDCSRKVDPVDGDQAEFRSIAFHKLEIIERGPVIVPLHVDAVSDTTE